MANNIRIPTSNNVANRLLLLDAFFAGYVVGSTAAFSTGFALYVYSLLGHDGGYDAASSSMRIKRIGVVVMALVLAANAVVAVLLIVMHAAGVSKASRLLQRLRHLVCCGGARAHDDEEGEGLDERDDHDFFVLSFSPSEMSDHDYASRSMQFAAGLGIGGLGLPWQMKRSLSLNDMEHLDDRKARFLSCFSSSEYEIQLLVADVTTE